MGRPKLPDSEKRQQVNFRLNPADRGALEAMAEAKETSVPALVEDLVVNGMELFHHPVMNNTLMRIFIEIMNEMQEVQQRNHDKPWHQDLLSWAACKMIFAKGPFARRNPDDWRENPALHSLWSKVTDAQRSKQEAINLLDELGVKVSAERYQSTYGRRGIFGGGHKMNALLGPVDNRIKEANEIDKIENDTTRVQAGAIFSIVETLDAKEQDALEKWHEQVANYTAEEKEGEALYKAWRREVVQRQIAQGQFPSYEDLY